MNLTILYRSKKIRFVHNVTTRQLALCAFVLSSAALLTYKYLAIQVDHQSLVATANTGLTQQKQQVQALKDETQQKLTGMMLKLGEMQSQLQRLNALGEKIAVQSNLSVDEFGFGQAIPAGGPMNDDVVPQIESSKEVLSKIDVMLQELEQKTEQLEVLESILLSHHISSESYLSGRPITSGWLSSYYGMRKDPFSGLPAMHKGVDFAGKEGDPVVATGAGIVTWSGQRYGYGQLVEIDHGNGVVTRYGHAKTLMVKVGDVVTKGQEVAKMGMTGRATGAHVHYEVLRNGKQIDPLKYVYREAAN
ncbi:MAG: peptidoglycan DD-metalloendopeptidase family protein [Alteromonadaceae bacterium]|nr:peptidoglycan DD-metalloendopeptidase family protein [Alteromonadaceae bacterium]